MAQQAATAAQPECLSLNSRTHVVEGENRFLQAVLCPPLLWQPFPYTQVNI